ncbi:MAG: dephospho-CoA kinase [Verrucomicrobiales bacterium]
MITIAVTGGVACGKSLVCSGLLELFPEGRASIFSCDVAVAELLEMPETVGRLMALEAPLPILDVESGRLDKTNLRKLVFENPAFREKLENLLHPLVREQLLAHAKTLPGETGALLVEVPLLYEANFPLQRDFDLVVAASVPTQRRRLWQERRIEPELANQMIKSQMPVEEKISRGDIVVWNDGDRNVLDAQVDHLASRLATLFE